MRRRSPQRPASTAARRATRSPASRSSLGSPARLVGRRVPFRLGRGVRRLGNSASRHRPADEPDSHPQSTAACGGENAGARGAFRHSLDDDRARLSLRRHLVCLNSFGGASAAPFGSMGAAPAMAIFAASLVGPGQVAARMVEFTFLRNLSPMISARLATGLHPIGAVLLGSSGRSRPFPSCCCMAPATAC